MPSERLVSVCLFVCLCVCLCVCLSVCPCAWLLAAAGAARVLPADTIIVCAGQVGVRRLVVTRACVRARARTKASRLRCAALQESLRELHAPLQSANVKVATA